MVRSLLAGAVHRIGLLHVPLVCSFLCLPWRTRVQALVEATGRSMALIKKEVDVSGDIGSVAAASRGQQRTMFAQARLTVAGVRS